MERALQAERDAEALQAIYKQELELKKQKKRIHGNKKLLRKKAMVR